MVMGITQALKLQEGPIDALARLPQQELIRMSQQGRIPADVLPIILNEKAQMAQQIANMQAAQQPRPPSVIEQAMATNAQAEARPQMMAGGPMGMPSVEPQRGMDQAREPGIAGLDVPEHMYGTEQGYASGGIVAFADGGDIPKYAGPDGSVVKGRAPKFEDLPTYRGDAVVPGSEISSFLSNIGKQDLRVDPITGRPVTFGEYMRLIDQRLAQSAAPTAQQMMPSVANVPTTSATDAIKQTTPEVEEKPAQPMSPPMSIQDIIRRSGEIATALSERKAPPVPTTKEAGVQVSELLKESGYDTGLLERQQRELQTEKESLAKDRDTAINMRILEAGLGIMAGESPYAFTNIGKGATPAVQGLAKDIKDLKTAERAYNRAVMDLDTKKNDFALSKAGISQKIIERAQDRVDKEQNNFDELKGKLANTMLHGEIQKDIAKASIGNKVTDFDKQWALYSADAKRRGETPTFDGFQTAIAGTRATLTYKDVALAVMKENPGMSPTELDSTVKQILANQQRAAGKQTTGPYQEGQEAKDKSGKPIVFKNGQWVYK